MYLGPLLEVTTFSGHTGRTGIYRSIFMDLLVALLKLTLVSHALKSLKSAIFDAIEIMKIV